MPAPFVEDAFFFLLYNISYFVKNHVFLGIWIPLVNISVFMPKPSCFHYCRSVIELDVRDGNASRSSFIVQDCFGYPGFLVFPYVVEYCSCKVFEELCCDFDGDCIESIDCLW